MDLKKAVTTRKSVRYFAPKIANWRKIIQAIDYARFAPAADNHFSNKFILVQDRKVIGKLAAAAQQMFIEEASHVVVVVSDSKYLVNMYGEKGERFTAQQTGAAIDNFLLGLNEKGLSSGWVGHFSDDLVKDALSIPAGLTVEAIFPIGKASRVKKPKEPTPIQLEGIIYFDKWKNKEMAKETRVTLDHA